MAAIPFEIIFETDLHVDVLDVNKVLELLGKEIGAEYFQSHVNESLQNEHNINIQFTEAAPSTAHFEVCPGWDSPCLKNKPKI